MSLTLTQVAEKLTLNKKQIMELINKGDFADPIPQYIPKVWSEEAIDEWKKNNKIVIDNIKNKQ